MDSIFERSIATPKKVQNVLKLVVEIHEEH
mgnify:CR=1 FL=1